VLSVLSCVDRLLRMMTASQKQMPIQWVTWHSTTGYTHQTATVLSSRTRMTSGHSDGWRSVQAIKLHPPTCQPSWTLLSETIIYVNTVLQPSGLCRFCNAIQFSLLWSVDISGGHIVNVLTTAESWSQVRHVYL